MDQAQSKKRAAFEDITNAHQLSEPETSGTVRGGTRPGIGSGEEAAGGLSGQLRRMHVAFGRQLVQALPAPNNASVCCF